jgi:hypothetical protein
LSDLFGDDGVERPGPGLAPSAFRIWRAGENPTDKGPVVVTPEAIEAVIAAQAVRGNRYSIDSDHLSLSKDAPPEARVALGWHSLEAREGEGGLELWACGLEWGEFARGQLEAKPPGLRYFSPAYDVHKETRELVRYLNLALTINPATWNTTALATAQAGGTTRMDDEKPLDMSAIMAALHKRATETTDEEERGRLEKMMKLAMPPKVGDAGGDDAPASDKAAEDPADDKAEPKKDAAPPFEKKDEEKKDGDKATVKASVEPTLESIAASLNGLLVREKARDASAISSERASLAARKGLAPELASIVRDPKTSIATARLIANTTKTAPIDLRTLGSETVAGTRGEIQGEHGTMQLPAEQAAQLKAAMGIRVDAQEKAHVDHTGRYVMPVETPTQTRARLAAAQKGQVAR